MSLRGSRCAFSTAAALHRVFIAPIERPWLSLPRHDIMLRDASRAYPQCQQRFYASGPPPKRRLPRNKEITSPFIQLVDADGKLSPRETTWGVLNSIDQKTHTLVAVAVPSPPRVKNRFGNSATDPDFPLDSEEQAVEYPICKIVENKELWLADKAKTKKKVNPAATLKTIELNWAIDGNDLNHRLDRIREFLGKGFRVEVMMAGKRRGRKATIEEATELVKRIQGVIDEIEGARELKPMEGKILAQATMFIEGKVQKNVTK